MAEHNNEGTQVAGQNFALTGVAKRPDPTRVPVRGDIAHIRLAGQIFVPHYVVPMAHKVLSGGTAVMASIGKDVLAQLPEGAAFDVLDMAAGHAWGEIPGMNVVGYVALDQLGLA